MDLITINYSAENKQISVKPMSYSRGKRVEPKVYPSKSKKEYNISQEKVACMFSSPLCIISKSSRISFLPACLNACLPS